MPVKTSIALASWWSANAASATQMTRSSNVR